MHPAVRVRRVALQALPVGLLALGLGIEGCGERESPLSPAASTATGATGVAVSRADKERNAVDLGPPTASALSAGGTRSAWAAGATATSIPFDPEPGPFANAGPDCDDCSFLGLTIGFSFTFFGNSYTTFNISSNGFIGFTPGRQGDGCCSGRTIPSADPYNNIIAAAWTDLISSPGTGGTISWQTRGRAPNRFLVVAYQNMPWYPGTRPSRVTTQIILFEGSNVIEIHTANQSSGHIYTQGVENATGTEAAFVAGRVAANYGLVNDGVRFTTSAASNSWGARASMPTARRAHAVAVASGLLYAIGGVNAAGPGPVLTIVEAYSAVTNSWSTGASLPAARQGIGAATIGTSLYVAGGHDAAGALTSTLYAYNVSTNSWSTRASMPVVGGCGGSAVIGGKLYVFSGCTRSSTGAQIAVGLLHRYDPVTNVWTTLRPAPTAHAQPAVGVISGKLYVVGGNNTANVTNGRLDVYNPATNTWTMRATMPTQRVVMAGAVVGGKLYVIGGRIGTNYLNTVQAYNPATNSWANRAPLPTGRAGLGAGVISNLIFAVGGRNSTSVLATNESYTP